MELHSSIPLGSYVQCDWCDHVYREEDGTPVDNSTGGFLFASKATGPCCAEKIEDGARRYDEDRFIGERCPDGVPFADWILDLRNRLGRNDIRIWTGTLEDLR